MSRASIGVALASAIAAAGCSAPATLYRPSGTAPTELTLAYDDGFQVQQAGQPVAKGPRYESLPELVACVPAASEHALQARSAGRTGVVLSGLSIGLAAGGLAGLGGLAFDDDRTKLAFLLSGVALEVMAIVTGAQSLSFKAKAHGNAIDAVNYYNDAVGASGAGCGAASYPPPPPPPQIPQ